MAFFALPNPTKEVTVKFPIDKVRTSINEVITSLNIYRLLEEDEITNRFRIFIKSEGISLITMDMGQHLDITLNEISPDSTKLSFEISRAVGVIDQLHEANRAAESLNSFITYFSKSLQGKLSEFAEQNEVRQKASANSLTVFLWGVIIITLLFIIIGVIRIRIGNGL